MPYTYTLTSVIPATPEEIYDAWLDSLSHTQMTGGEASMSDEIGTEVSAWDGYISGRNLELVPGERIVQSWRTSKFADAHEDSIVTITLKDADDGTLLTLVHSNVPDDQRKYEDGGWESNYFEPMRVYFAKLARKAGEQEAEATPAASKSAAKPRRAASKKLKTAEKPTTPRRAAKPNRAKKATPRKRPSAKKKKAKRAAAPKATRRSAARPAKKRKAAPRAGRKSARRQRSRR